MEFPFINSRLGFWVYDFLTYKECCWRHRNGLPQQTRHVHIRENAGMGRLLLVRVEEIRPPRHPVYGRLIEFMFWLGFVPF